MSNNAENEKKPFYKKWWVWVIAVVLLSGIGSAMRGGNNSANSSAPAQTTVSEWDYSSLFETTGTSEAVTTITEETSAAVSETSAPFMLNIEGFGVENWGEIDTGNLELNTGELLSVVYSEGDVVIVKAKIQSLISNDQTIKQNYYNVGDLIKKHGFDACQELQYWAVADTVSGDEIKVISFTLDRATIEGVESNTILENQLGDYVSDLFIHNSLLD